MSKKSVHFDNLRSLPLPDPRAAVIELRLCKLLLPAVPPLPPPVERSMVVADEAEAAAETEFMPPLLPPPPPPIFDLLSDFMHKFSGASPSSVMLDDVDALPLKFNPAAQSFDESILESLFNAAAAAAAAATAAPDLDKLYAPFEFMVGGNLITSTRSL